MMCASVLTLPKYRECLVDSLVHPHYHQPYPAFREEDDYPSEKVNPLPLVKYDYDLPENGEKWWEEFLTVEIHLPYTTGKRVDRKKVTTRESTFKEFVDECKTPKQLSTLRDKFAAMDKSSRGKVKAPNPYVVPGHIPSGKRGRANVASITLLCIDIDMPEFADKAAAALPALKLNHFAYPTISSDVPDVKTREAGLRLRIFVETDGAIPVQLYQPAVESFLATLFPGDLNVDTASFKPENAMFLPMCFKDDEDWEPLSILTDGEVFAADMIEQRPREEPELETDRPAATSDEIALANMPSGEPSEKIQSALAAIPPDIEYSEWYRILSGIHHETGGSEEGWEILDMWSSGKNDTAYNYDEEENREFWDGLTKKKPVINPVTIASVFAAAKTHGWDPKGWDREVSACDPNELDGLTPEEARSRWEALPLEQRGARVYADRSQRKRPPELVKGLLTGNGTIGVVGDSQTGKSTFLTSLACSVVTGRGFLDRKIGKPIPDCPNAVFYIAAEDVVGIEDRWRANLKAQDLDLEEWDDRFLVRETPADIHEKNQLMRLYEAIHLYEIGFGVKVRLVVFDTLRANASDGTAENSNDDMNRAVMNIHQVIQKPLGCACVLTHHTNKSDKSVFSGGNAFRGALDQLLLLKRDQRIDAVEMVGNKYRGGDASKMDGWFKIHVEPLGISDDDGEEISSVCAMEADDGSMQEVIDKESRNPKKIAEENELTILRTLQEKPSESEAELLRRTELADKSFRNALRRLADEKLVKVKKVGRSNTCCITKKGQKHLEQESDQFDDFMPSS